MLRTLHNVFIRTPYSRLNIYIWQWMLENFVTIGDRDVFSTRRIPCIEHTSNKEVYGICTTKSFDFVLEKVLELYLESFEKITVIIIGGTVSILFICEDHLLPQVFSSSMRIIYCPKYSLCCWGSSVTSSILFIYVDHLFSQVYPSAVRTFLIITLRRPPQIFWKLFSRPKFTTGSQ